MSITIIGFVVIALFIAIIIAFVIVTFNDLVKSKNNVKNALAQIDTQLQRRFDLIPNLVEVVKGYASHEKELLDSVTASRSGYMNASTEGEKLEVNNQLSSTLKTLFAVTENYPELKANKNFERLQEDLAETEEKVAYARQFYNDSVTIYNNKIQMFPGNIVAKLFGHKAEMLFDADEVAQNAPKVQF